MLNLINEQPGRSVFPESFGHVRGKWVRFGSLCKALFRIESGLILGLHAGPSCTETGESDTDLPAMEMPAQSYLRL